VSPVVKPKGTGLVEKLVELLLILLYFGFAVLGLALVLSRAKESYNFIQKVPWAALYSWCPSSLAVAPEEAAPPSSAFNPS